MKIRVEINKTENRKTIKRVSETKSFILQKDQQIWQNFNQTDKKREKSQVTKIRNERGDITIDATKKRNYSVDLCINKMDTFLEKQNLPRWNLKKFKILNNLYPIM